MMLSSIKRDVTFLCIAVFLTSALATEALAAPPLPDRFQVAWGKNKKQDKKEDSQTQAAPDSSGSGSGSATAAVQPSSKSELDVKMESLASQIAKNFTGGGKVKIAVFNFVDLHGNTSQLGMFIAEELITRLFQCGSFEVVERRLLDKVLEEQKLSTTGLLEADSAQKIGSVLGVKAIVTGTVTDLESAVKINARIISADTGSVSAAAGETIKKDDDVAKLLASLQSTPITETSPVKSSNNAAPANNSPASTQATAASSTSKSFFREDFSSVGDGLIPAGWTGADHALVKKSGSKKYLAPFEKGVNKIIIPGINFPEGDFKVTWACHYAPGKSSGEGETKFKLTIGNLSAGIENRFYRDKIAWINETIVAIPAVNDKTFLMTLEKRDQVWRLYIDGTQTVLARVSSFQKPNTMVLDFGEFGFCLYSIEGESL